MNITSVCTRVGKYELGKTLGEGTFAKVKYAKNMETGESVAIKVLDKDKVLKHKMVEQVGHLTFSSTNGPVVNVVGNLQLMQSATDLISFLSEKGNVQFPFRDCLS